MLLDILSKQVQHQLLLPLTIVTLAHFHLIQRYIHQLNRFLSEVILLLFQDHQSVH